MPDGTNNDVPVEMRLLKGMTALYKQNQEILEVLKSVVGEKVPTPMNAHQYPLTAKDKPWEKWTKTKDGEPVPEEIKDTFKL